jgi:Domain of unknown function (DUF4328)
MSSLPAAGAAVPDQRRPAQFALLMRIVIAALLACAAADLVAVVFDVSYHYVIHTIMAGNFVSRGDAQAADDRQSAIAWAQLGLFLATGALFIAWFHGAYSNLRRLGISSLRFGTKWAVGSWFVPFLNLVRPKAIANDIWRGSDPGLPQRSSPDTGSVPWFINAWWAAFILATLVSRIAFQTGQNAKTLSALGTATNFSTVADAVDFVAALLAVVVVYQIFARQRARAAGIAVPGAGDHRVEAKLGRGYSAAGTRQGPRWTVSGAIAALVLLVGAVIVGALVAPSSSRSVAAPHKTPSSSVHVRVLGRLSSIALKPSDGVSIAGTRVDCAVSRDQGLTWVDCWNLTTLRRFTPIKSSYGISVSQAVVQIERLVGRSTRTVQQLDQPKLARLIRVPPPLRTAQQENVPLGAVLPIGGTNVVCETQRINRAPSVVCGAATDIAGSINALNVTFPVHGYAVLISPKRAGVIEWIDRTNDFRFVVLRTQPHHAA